MSQRVLITAAASGIGLEIARAFSATGVKVFTETRQSEYETDKT